jgi:SAM-dependent methyltransferase
VWRGRDQSGNSRAAAERNAVTKGIRDQTELADADARDLPFASASFDVVVASLAISNIRDAGGRAQALREMVRVLRPGGQLRIADQGADRYAAVLVGGAAAPAGPCDNSTGGPGPAGQVITSSWSQPPGHRLTPRRPQGYCSGRSFGRAAGRGLPGATVRAKIPRVARSALSGITGKMAASFQLCSAADQS